MTEAVIAQEKLDIRSWKLNDVICFLSLKIGTRRVKRVSALLIAIGE